MFDVWKSGLAALLIVGIVGCQTASNPPAPLTTVTVEEGLEVVPPAPLTPAPIATSAPPASLMPTVNATSARPAMAVQPIWPTNGFNTWISLESWGKYNNLGKPNRVSAAPYPTYQVQGTNAAMSIKVGSRIAYCNGLECWLGYAPQLINGSPYIHALDAQKNFQPLLSLPNYRFKTNRTIVIDPGHGGKDSGARSVFNGEFEKTYTLDWAQRMAKLLASNGWNVVLTRTRDIDVSLQERVAASDRANADVFLSLHFNSGLPNRELAGIETYCLTPVGMPSNLIRTYEDDPRQSYPNNVFDEQNFQMAVRLHRALLQSTGATDRGLRRARFMGVLRGQNRPAVLLEAGYLSNAGEARSIASPEYRQKLAEASVKALE